MILVTGASGFLGQHLLEALSRNGEAVRASYCHHHPGIDFPNVEWMACDLLDTEEADRALKGVDRVYHCAATVSFDPKDKNKLVRENVTITENLVNAALSANIRKFVHVSSVAALGRRQKSGKDHPISEKDLFEEGKDNSQYAISKYLGEMEVWRGMAEGLNAVIVNPAIILGKGDWAKGSAKLMQVCDEEFPWYTRGMTGWVDARDVVQAMSLLMNSDITNERFILCAGNYTYKDIFSQMALAIGKRPPYKLARKWLTGIVWRMAFFKSRLKGKEATITRETARTAQKVYRFDNNKFLNAFPGFRYRAVEETIREMAASFLRDGKM
ncbi:MAG TPA: NAD-dependent epimerase/dehydratase family protein [Edaphocola sp.]|nr:NAD-dependent epimerase/dehydratase family protein [Edaphocola sp.]